MTQQKPVRKRHLAVILIAFVAVVLLWRGVWEVSAKLFSPEASLVLGVFILLVIAALERRPIYRFFGWE